MRGRLVDGGTRRTGQRRLVDLHRPEHDHGPYVLPVADGVHIESLLTVGDGGAASNGYEMVGIPDGLGMIQQGANLVLYMNQELRDAQGIARRHGETGAFVSRWVIDPETLRVKEGSDLINPGVLFWDYPSGTYVTSGARWADGTLQERTFGRFCSGTLSDPGRLLQRVDQERLQGPDLLRQRGGWRHRPRLRRDQGRRRDGPAAARPVPWENTIPAPNESDTTLVMGQEDGPAGNVSQPWVYVGTKQQQRAAGRQGRPDERRRPRHRRGRPGRHQPTPSGARPTARVSRRTGPDRRQRLEPDRRRPERRRPRRRPQPQPDRGRPLGPEQPERLLLRHDRGWPEQRREPDRDRSIATVAGSGASPGTTSRTRTSARR